MDLIRSLGFDLNNKLFLKVLYSILIILILSILRWILTRMILKRIEDPKSRFNTRKTIAYTVMVIGILLVGRVWFEGISSLTTYLGLLSAGIAIALKDLFANLAGWIFIIWRKPFVTGNRIQIENHAGDVIDIRPFQFTILEIGNWVRADQSTGRMIHIPNGMILTSPISNYDSGFQYIWNEIPVLITFESNWQVAKKILDDISTEYARETTLKAQREIEETARKFYIYYKNLTPKVYTSVEDSGVLLTIRYLTSIRERRGSAEKIWEQVLESFAEHNDIDLAYPTARLVGKLN
ncbi:MAG: mechanosensitive ion channel family protein [Candidatus Syntrophosphaera sp.]|nr:mechanosensitive ion channel family protein [Candidatus Syntrophosphaera sp.]